MCARPTTTIELKRAEQTRPANWSRRWPRARAEVLVASISAPEAARPALGRVDMRAPAEMQICAREHINWLAANRARVHEQLSSVQVGWPVGAEWKLVRALDLR